MRDRVDRWIRSDLIGIPIAVLAAAIALLSILAIYLGPIRGLVFSAPVWGFGLYLAIRGSGQRPSIGDLSTARDEKLHRILVIANRGLDSPALCDEVCRRAQGTPSDVMVLAPVTASSRLGVVTDDFDAESRLARQRLDRALQTLRERGVRANGHVDDDADPMSTLVDGLREFSADEVVILAGDERGWDRMGPLADRVRREVGLPVTEVSAQA